MKLVIDIPENTYKQIQALARNNYFEHDICGNSMRRIANGTPLPKGHGRLIECERLQEVFRRNVVGYAGFKQLFDNAPTIIEADKEASDG